MAFLPDSGILITERPGRLRIIRNGVLEPKRITGLPEVRAKGIGGLMDVALHHLARYIDEQAFRYNKRHTTDADRFVQLSSMVAGKRLVE